MATFIIIPVANTLSIQCHHLHLTHSWPIMFLYSLFIVENNLANCIEFKLDKKMWDGLSSQHPDLSIWPWYNLWVYQFHFITQQTTMMHNDAFNLCTTLTQLKPCCHTDCLFYTSKYTVRNFPTAHMRFCKHWLTTTQANNYIIKIHYKSILVEMKQTHLSRCLHIKMYTNLQVRVK